MHLKRQGMIADWERLRYQTDRIYVNISVMEQWQALRRIAPIMIANDVVEKLQESTCIQEAEAVAPGFINLKLDREFLAGYLNQMSEDAHLGFETAKEPKTIIVDYGGANVAKPLHVGHLRSAIIGESIKRIGKFAGHHVIGDVHLGDWGYQMGLVITELKKRKPELPYFDENFAGCGNIS